MSKQLADAMLEITKAAASPLIAEVKALRARVEALEQEKSARGACGLARELEPRVRACEQALGLTQE